MPQRAPSAGWRLAVRALRAFSPQMRALCCALLAWLVSSCDINHLLSTPAGTGPVPAQLAFMAQPAEAQAGGMITPAVEVAVVDSVGNPVATFDSTVTVALARNPGGATLSGTLSVVAIHGVAAFQDLRLDKAGSGYTLTATVGSMLPPVVSDPFLVVPGSAATLRFTGQPSDALPGDTIRPPVRVTAFDSLGNVATGYTGLVDLVIYDDGSLLMNARLSGHTTVAASGGTATFTDLSIDQPGQGYTLAAAFGGGDLVVKSAFFNVGVP